MTNFNIRKWESLKENSLKPSAGYNIFICIFYTYTYTECFLPGVPDIPLNL